LERIFLKYLTLPKRTTAIAAVAVALSISAHANDVIWANDAFRSTNTIAPGKIAEQCTDVERGASVRWKFVADGALQFNIHRHAGNDVIYANRSYNTRELDGVFKPSGKYQWCWMWTNETATAVSVRIEMKRE
jgi:hypothetical protein